MKPLFIRKVKRGGGNGLWGSYPVERDEFGLWLYHPEQCLFKATHSDGVLFCHAGQPEPPGLPVIHLIPTTGWWFARWQGTGVFIDICTPAQLEGDVWSYDDLELDLFKFTDGRWGIEDEDEFDERVAAGFISLEEVEASWSTVAELKRRLSAADDLLDETGWRKLRHYIGKDFAPLTTFPAD